ncbi:MAG: HD domain-containing protein [Desulfuromonadaceae bacterium]
MVADIEFRLGTHIEDTFRIHRPVQRLARNNSKYMSCELKDRSDAIRAYAWLNRYQGVQLVEGALVQVSGSLRWFADRWFVDIASTTPADTQAADPLKYLPDEYCPIPNGITRLSKILSQLQILQLREFMFDVLRDDRITLPFLKLAASYKHHHAYAGGLLEHSLECAEFVLRAAVRQDIQTELLVCAALLHDIGKTRTLDWENNRWVGTLLGHDLLTLEILAHQLSKLDQVWPDGATALRYLLSWKLQERKGKRPLMTAVELLQSADRISCGMHNEAELFNESPEWKRIVSDDTGRRFWRPGRVPARAT